MKHIKTLLFSLSALALLAVGSCKKEKCQDPQNPQCENYDPCFGKRTINTFFKVRPGDRGFPPPPDWCELIPTDTFNESSVRFEIPDNSLSNSTFSWQIGTEAQPRTGKAFEVDFEDYLTDNGWERSIPVTLTIRTPMNSCLSNPKDTLATITRELFFTQNIINFWEGNINKVSYKGFLTESPNQENVVQFIKIETGNFRGIDGPLLLLVGLPVSDTIMFPKYLCGHEFCFNFKHQKYKYLNVEKCSDSPLTNYMSKSEWIFLDGSIKIKNIFEFNKPTGIERYEFQGIKM